LSRRLLAVLIAAFIAGISLLASQGFGGTKAIKAKPAGTVALSTGATADLSDYIIQKRSSAVESIATTTSTTPTTLAAHVDPPTSVTTRQVQVAAAAPPKVVVTTPRAPAPAPAPAPVSGLGGLPPIFNCIIQHESGGNPRAVNPHSGAAGLFQFMPSTWHSLGYSGSAADYPASVQYEAARRLYASSGTRPWAGDGCV
jgi:hypothetical protein